MPVCDPLRRACGMDYWRPMVGSILSALVILSLVAIGLGAIAAPQRAWAQYGIVLDDPRALAFVRAMGVRDAVIAGLLALMALERARSALAWGIALAALIALTDFLVVRVDRRAVAAGAARMDATLALHAGGAIGLLLTAAALLAGF